MKLPKNRYKLFFIFAIAALLLNFIMSTVAENAVSEALNPLLQKETLDLIEIFVYMVIMTPFFETVIFQVLPIELFQKIKWSKMFTIVICAIIFAMAHAWDYGFVYALLVIPMGLLFAVYYVVLRERGRVLAILSVSLIHGILNLVSFFINFY